MSERHRRNSTVDLLQPEIKVLVERMLAAAPRRTYADIRAAVLDATKGAVVLTDSTLSRYWQNYFEGELRERRRMMEAAQAQRQQVREIVGQGGDPEALTAAIMEQLDAALVANMNDPSRTDPVKLVAAKASLMRAASETRKNDLRKRALDAQLAKLELERQRLQRELDEKKAEDERKQREAAAALANVGDETTLDEKAQIALGAIRKALGISKDAA